MRPAPERPGRRARVASCQWLWQVGDPERADRRLREQGVEHWPQHQHRQEPDQERCAAKPRVGWARTSEGAGAGAWLEAFGARRPVGLVRSSNVLAPARRGAQAPTTRRSRSTLPTAALTPSSPPSSATPSSWRPASRSRRAAAAAAALHARHRSRGGADLCRRHGNARMEHGTPLRKPASRPWTVCSARVP
eukprot:4248136-Prymnesium_polylepis.3